MTSQSKQVVNDWLAAFSLPEFKVLAELIADKAPVDQIKAAEAKCAPLIDKQAAILCLSLQRARQRAQ